VIEIRDLRVSYGATEVISGIDLTIEPGQVLAVVGPSGCGKSTLLRCLNRLTPPSCRIQGSITLDGAETRRMDSILLRRRVGMVFQKPNPFPMSIRENVLYGLKAQGKGRAAYAQALESSLTTAALWHEVKARLDESAHALSVGQQQRLCIARALAVSPEVILMDEPAASLDPTSTAELESSIIAMKGKYTVVVVTHDIAEARRVSDAVAYLKDGHLVEFGETAQMFTAPRETETKEYLGVGSESARPQTDSSHAGDMPAEAASSAAPW
jgi:phosphate transport system ATP-binding protein